MGFDAAVQSKAVQGYQGLYNSTDDAQCLALSYDSMMQINKLGVPQGRIMFVGVHKASLDGEIGSNRSNSSNPETGPSEKRKSMIWDFHACIACFLTFIDHVCLQNTRRSTRKVRL